MQSTITLEAKVDSGADHSSLHAIKIEAFESNGLQWVSFETVHGKVIEKPVVRVAQIKTKAKGVQDRYVVQLAVCFAGRVDVVEVNLVNRSHFNYPMIIGRSAMATDIRIHPQATFLNRLEGCR